MISLKSFRRNVHARMRFRMGTGRAAARMLPIAHDQPVLGRKSAEIDVGGAVDDDAESAMEGNADLAGREDRRLPERAAHDRVERGGERGPRVRRAALPARERAALLPCVLDVLAALL